MIAVGKTNRKGVKNKYNENHFIGMLSKFNQQIKVVWTWVVVVEVEGRVFPSGSTGLSNRLDVRGKG